MSEKKKPEISLSDDMIYFGGTPLTVQIPQESFQRKFPPLTPTTCKEGDEFSSWLQKQFPYLAETTQFNPSFTAHPFTQQRVDDARRGYKVDKAPWFLLTTWLPDGATPYDMDEAINRLSLEYVRKCKVMSLSSPHECDAAGCIHNRFREAIDDLVAMARELRNDEAKTLRDKLADRDESEAALRREEKALRDKLEEKDKAESALRKKLADKGEAESALRREVKALREKLEEAEKALREKEQKLESVYQVFREVVGMPATPQPSPDPPTPSRDNVPTSKQGVFERWQGGPAPHPGEQHPTGTWVDGQPRTPSEIYWQEQMNRNSRV